ncbi:hypothetical protein F5B20DRAFT_483109 [Whalleya microplaca]|nr:hypothetical protein F5B20DRAFT_483109 [Whalleya microplaca]
MSESPGPQPSGQYSDTHRGANFNDRIDIWRTEVLSSPTFCVCSAPPTRAGSERTSGQGGSSPSPLSPASSSNNAAGGPDPPAAPVKQPATLFRPWALFKTKSAPNTHRICPMCSRPIEDDVSFVTFKGDGAGKVRMSEVVQAEASSKKAKGGTAAAKGKEPTRKRLIKAVSGYFKSPNTPAKGSGKENGKVGETSQAGQTGEQHPEGTAMYGQLLYHRGGEGGDDDSMSVDTLGGLSDDARGKPQLTIDDTAARLRRAQRLLNKSHHR